MKILRQLLVGSLEYKTHPDEASRSRSHLNPTKAVSFKVMSLDTCAFNVCKLLSILAFWKCDWTIQSVEKAASFACSWTCDLNGDGSIMTRVWDLTGFEEDLQGTRLDSAGGCYLLVISSVVRSFLTKGYHGIILQFLISISRLSPALKIHKNTACGH